MARSITIEDLYHIKFLSCPRISPDGQHVAYVVTTIDERAHAYRSAIWIAPVAGGEARRFTSGPAHATSPSWSPDGRWLAFVSERAGDTEDNDVKEAKRHGKGKPQIWLIPTDGGEARQLTSMEHGASHPVWSPDSKQLLFSAQVGPADEETEDGKPLPRVHVIDRLWYKLDGVGYIYKRRAHLFLIDSAGGEPRQLTDGDWDDGEPAWSPDGKQIAFISNHREDRWRWPGDDLYVLTLQDGQAVRCLTTGAFACNAPSWSPDGKTIAFLAATKRRSAGQVQLFTLSAAAEHATPTNLSQAFDGACIDMTNSDLGDEHLIPAPAWSADGQTLHVLASYHGAARVFAIPVTGADAQPPTLTPGDVHVRDFSIDAAHNTMALLIDDSTHPQEIFVCSTSASGELQRISHANDAFLAELTLAKAELFPYTGADGWSIDGWIMKPQDFDPQQKYPLVVEIHGGPNTQYGYGFFHEMQMLVAQGYVVFYCNPRGSMGYGFDFADSIREAWGEKDSVDIMLGVEEVIRQGYIDEQRLAVTGGSYGGFMTNWIIGHYDRFNVAITDRCVSDLVSVFGSSDIGWDLTDEVLATVPWEDLDKYRHMSPISYVQQMHTPLLIIHSEQDLRCNIEQSQQLFTALKWMERDVVFVIFEGQSHGLSRGGHPRSRLERLRHIKSWFAKYLK